MKIQSKNKAFTLIELLIAVAILAILAGIGLGSFRTAQMRGRDAERKSDLKQIANALELYFSDYRQYPGSLPWGDEFKDEKDTTYMKVVPEDPGSGAYFYEVNTTDNKYNKYRLFARLENSEDKNINSEITGVTCGTEDCNFSVTSANTTPTETW